MDQQEETIEQINKKRRKQSTFTFPLDLISEILSKLPAKSVGRFRCVSKLWSSITTAPYFINKFETQSRQKKPSLLVTFKKGDRLFVFSIPQDRQSSNEPHTIPSQPGICPRLDLLLSKSKKTHNLEPYNEKVVHPNQTRKKMEHYVYTYPAYVCTNGFIYYTAYADKTDRIGFIMSFDVRSEKFRHSITLWILQDAEKHVWSPKNFLVPFHYYDQSLKLVCNLIGITDAGEIVYVPERCYKSFYVIYYDSERNKFHRVEYKGIADDESRLKNGLVRSRLFNIPIVRNHMESLMSF
ncbi:BnaC06g04000D [Brassica napus]|uniref:BnaC06g04000D protein n=1 Tax=Brassica napus TaxID=3708 RepID=A0A078GFB7_BRANA|nr:BnaC06g04000D [Brassica napus]